jgi:hypothetical protein
LREALGAAARQELDTRDYTWQGNAARVTAAVAADAARQGTCGGAASALGRSVPRGSQ